MVHDSGGVESVGCTWPSATPREHQIGKTGVESSCNRILLLQLNGFLRWLQRLQHGILLDDQEVVSDAKDELQYETKIIKIGILLNLWVLLHLPGTCDNG